MLRNYLTTAIRNFWKNKTFSFINILGLALGMACSLLIVLWVNDERNVDAFHENKERIYTIYERQFYDGKVEAGFSTPGLLPEEMKRVMPEIEYSTGLGWFNEATFAVGKKIVNHKGTFASQDFLTMFSYPLLHGDKRTALKDPTSIAISRKMAEVFFGNAEAAIGKTIRYENMIDYQVSAVFENVPDNSSFKFDYLLNWDQFLEYHQWAKEWGNNGPETIIMLKANADPNLVKQKIVKFLDNYNKDQGPTFRIELDMQRFDERYLNSNFKNGVITGGRSEYVRLFTIVAIFILVIACINFMNLTTARSIKRSKEIGIRKVVGALRGSLMGQFLGEAVFLAFLSMVLSLVIVALLLPAFNALTLKNISIGITDPGFWLMLLALTIVTGLLSGSYPALFLSGFRPIGVLKGTMKFTSSAVWFRKGLVVFQFVLSTILIIGTIIISKQVSYVQSTNLGYDKENLIFIPIEGELVKNYDLMKQKLSALPELKNVSRITATPTSIEQNTGGVSWDGKDPNVSIMFTQAAVGYDFMKTMNLKLLLGRDFSKDLPTDSVGYIINESALARIGYKDPIGKPLTFWGVKGHIIGVVKDFHFTSLHTPIQPLVLRHDREGNYGNVLVRTSPGKLREAIAKIGQICKVINPEFPFTYYFADEEYQKLYEREQVISKLSNYFAILAIFISCLGLLGLAMFTAEQRMKEIGIRKVLGATIGSVFALLSRDFLVLVFIALLIASPIAWMVMSNWLQDYTYRIPIAWWMFALAGGAAILIALLTVSFQSMKAAMANPIKSLRTE
jgi:putative ABC transport system permease protein